MSDVWLMTGIAIVTSLLVLLVVLDAARRIRRADQRRKLNQFRRPWNDPEYRAIIDDKPERED